MKKWLIATLIAMLLITAGVKQVQCPIQTQNKNTLQSVTDTTNTNDTMCAANKTQDDEYIIMVATAYTRSREEGTYDGITRSGVEVSRGIVATDPDVIPMGTKIYIEGYGYAECLDTGGDIRHNRIDLYMETKEEAFEWGRKEVKVYILDDNKNKI